MKLKKLILSLVLLLFWIFPSHGQVEQERLIGAYTYNFAQYTTWLNESDLHSFHIVLISSNRKVIDEFKDFTRKKSIKGKPISLDVFNDIPAQLPENAQIIVITEDKSDEYNKVYRLTEDWCVLLISQNIIDKRNVMINLYSTPEKALVFEVNKANVINHNLIIDPEILLLGGTEIDVAELYRNSQKSIENLQDKLVMMNDSFVVLNKRIHSAIDQLDAQKSKIDDQSKMLVIQKNELDEGRNKIKQNTAEIEQKQLKIQEQTELLNTHEGELKKQKEELEQRQRFISNQQLEIQDSRFVLDSLTSEIKAKNIVLGKQSTTIQRQKLTVILAITTIVLFIIVLVVIIIGYRGNLRKNKLLIEQKEKIENINNTLHSSNQSLFNTIGKLKETQSQLVNSEKMASLGVLTAGIAHEINNPVNFIYTGINSLKRDMDELLGIIVSIEEMVKEKSGDDLIKSIEETKIQLEYSVIVDIIQQTIDDIKVGAERTTEIVKGLRNFSRIDKDNKQMYNVHEGIESALLLLKNKYKNHIEIERSFGEVPAIECYAGKLNQVFLNIISNAIDAIHEAGKISIKTWNENNKVHIQFIDNGRGIPSDSIDKIFDPFFTTKNVGEGVGLGLSISFGIIKEHNGKIEVKSELNTGTTFTISLPCS